MNFDHITLATLNADHSGHLAFELHKAGYERRPVVQWGDHLYVMLITHFPRPGHNTAEVIDVTGFDAIRPVAGEPPYFKILVSTAQRHQGSVGWAWVKFGDEGFSILTTIPDGSTYDYTSPTTAVLSWQVVPPTAADVRAVADDLERQLDEFGPGPF